MEVLEPGWVASGDRVNNRGQQALDLLAPVIISKLITPDPGPPANNDGGYTAYTGGKSCSHP